MGRLLGFLYGLASYLLAFGTLLYAIGFVSGLFVPKTIDTGTVVPLVEALVVNLLLMSLFAVQHSVMARKQFKHWLTQYIPQSVERSTYVLFSGLALILLFWQWRPIGATIWQVENDVGRALLYAGFAFGWLLLLASTFLINHFDLFGLRQVWLYFRGRPYVEIPFRTPALYKIVRHPLYVGWLFAFWCTPVMTAAHLLFAIMTTAYILIAIQFEERDLTRAFPEYDQYRRRVPMLIPFKMGRTEQRSGSRGLAP